jgi:hypothetical protein
MVNPGERVLRAMCVIRSQPTASWQDTIAELATGYEAVLCALVPRLSDVPNFDVQSPRRKALAIALALLGADIASVSDSTRRQHLRGALMQTCSALNVAYPTVLALVRRSSNLERALATTGGDQPSARD